MTKRIALITGGNRGLGKSTVLNLAKQQVDCVFTYRSHSEEAQQVVREAQKLGAKAVALQLDLSDILGFTEFSADLKRVLDENWQVAHFDYLVNNAGFSADSGFLDTSEATFDRLMNVHVKGVFFLTQTLAGMINTGGSIVNISTGLTRFSFPGKAVYATMKGAVEVLTKYMAKELAQQSIRVNVVAPGPVATDFGDGRVRDDQDMNQRLSSLTALGRVGEADDIGAMIAQLLSDECGWVNGQRIEVSGGMLL